MPGVNYVSSSLNRTKPAQADEEAYPRLPPGYVRRKSRGMFSYLKPPPPLLPEENNQLVENEEGQTQEEEPEIPQTRGKNDSQEGQRQQPTPRNSLPFVPPIIQPKGKLHSIDFGFSWAVPFTPARQEVEEPFGNSGKVHISRKDPFPASAHHLPWFMTWDNNSWPGKAESHLMKREEEPRHYHSIMSSPYRRVRKILGKNNISLLDLSLRPSQSRTHSPYKRQKDLNSKGQSAHVHRI
ncbi:hypothetical protein C356_04454 [Cryptococcus neoformans c45]|nr:hypothetical protein C356_04454 [Cryptococcus neoformans var. grubii c45]